jgi:type II secretory pathway component PulF
MARSFSKDQTFSSRFFHGVPMIANQVTSTRPRWPATIVLILLALLLWLALGLAMVFVVPHYERIFDEFKLRLPSSTTAVIAVSRWLDRYWYVALIALLPGTAVVVAISVCVRHLSHSRWLNGLWWAVLLLLPVALGIVVAVSIYLPLVSLIEGLAK